MVFASDAQLRLFGVLICGYLTVWGVLFFAAHYVSLWIARSVYVYLLPPEKALWRQSALAMVHAVIVSSGGMLIALFNLPTYTHPMFAYSEQALLFYSATTAHAAATTAVAIYHARSELASLGGRSYASAVGWETATIALLGLVGVPVCVAYRQATWFVSTVSIFYVYLLCLIL